MTNINEIAQKAYSDFSNWNKAAAPAIFKAEDENQLQAASDQAGLFDFQNNQTYYSGLKNLALGEVQDADEDGDGKISYEEYKAQAMREYKGVIDDETLSELNKNDETVQMIFWSEDCDIDDYISDLDLELFYSIADESLGSEENKREKDGKFSQEDLSQASETLLNMLSKENPQLEKELRERRYNLYDIDQDGSIQKEEFMIMQQDISGDTSAEAKAKAYCMYDLIDSKMGEKDTDGAIDKEELSTYIEEQYNSGCSPIDYYDKTIESHFTSENAKNYEYYNKVLKAYEDLYQA